MQRYGILGNTVDVRPIVMATGALVMILALFMIIAGLASYLVANEQWQIFMNVGLISLVLGVFMFLSNRVKGADLDIRQAFLLTTTVWVVLPAFSALPIYYVMNDIAHVGKGINVANTVVVPKHFTYASAYFEAMSGLTTTGSTVITHLDEAGRGLLMWRSMLQWLGGIGIVVMALSVFPMLQVGGMQLFRMEYAESMDKALPRATAIGKRITLIYVGLTVICAGLYYAQGMTKFDAVNHAMTTVATGGYSTRDGSIAFFNSVSIEWTATAFMIIGSLPFMLYVYLLNRLNPRPLFTDAQVRGFFLILCSAVGVMILYQVTQLDREWRDAIRSTSFNVVSIMTGTGYATEDYNQWGTLGMPLFFFLMLVGGCAGSTSCGIKVFRFQVLFQIFRAQRKRLLAPNGVFIPHYNGKPLPPQVEESVMGFFYMYLVLVAVTAGILGFLGLDFITALSGAMTAVSNVGPGLGDVIGPTGNFSTLSDGAKWTLSVAMLLGRLEILTVMVLFSRSFWQN